MGEWDSYSQWSFGSEARKEINDFLGVDNTVAVTNGTIALQIAIKALSLKGEIITSPFSWIASIAAIQWEGCKPVYVDADIDTFNIDVSKIEDAITEIYAQLCQYMFFLILAMLRK